MTHALAFDDSTLNPLLSGHLGPITQIYLYLRTFYTKFFVTHPMLPLKLCASSSCRIMLCEGQAQQSFKGNPSRVALEALCIIIMQDNAL